MPHSESWTIGRLLEWTTGYLEQRGADAPRLDAEVLLAEALSCQRIELYTRFDEIPGEPARTAFRELVRRRAEGAPVAYLVGRREFYSLSFRVTPDVLIPRPETEFVVIRLLDLAAEWAAALGQDAGGAGPAIADVGTGSGIIAICAARRIASSRVLALDVSRAALAVAAANARDHGVIEQIEFVESDLFAKVPPDRRFDFIVSNPPYVSSGEMAALAPDVRSHEPRLALEAGPQGTAVIERLVPQAAERLLPDGWLLMEISPQLDAVVREIVQRSGAFELFPTVKDLAHLPRVVQARRKEEGGGRKEE
jgi:release factor glutamine methyltransferase